MTGPDGPSGGEPPKTGEPTKSDDGYESPEDYAKTEKEFAAVQERGGDAAVLAERQQSIDADRAQEVVDARDELYRKYGPPPSSKTAYDEAKQQHFGPTPPVPDESPAEPNDDSKAD